MNHGVVVTPPAVLEASYPAAYLGVLAVGSVGPDGPSRVLRRGDHIAVTARARRSPWWTRTAVTQSPEATAVAFVVGVAADPRRVPQLKPEQVVEAITSGAQAADPAAAGQPGYGAEW